jgi:hypothetical protein
MESKSALKVGQKVSYKKYIIGVGEVDVTTTVVAIHPTAAIFENGDTFSIISNVKPCVPCGVDIRHPFYEACDALSILKESALTTGDVTLQVSVDLVIKAMNKEVASYLNKTYTWD